MTACEKAVERPPVVLISRVARLAPLSAWLVYSIGTVLAFAFGPFVYNVPSPLLFYSYLAAVHAAVITGYLGAKPRRQGKALEKGPGVTHIIWILLAFTAAGALVRTIEEQRIGLSLGLALNDPFQSRNLWLMSEQANGLLRYSWIGLQAAEFPLYAIAFSYWDQLARVHKVAVAGVALWLCYSGVIGAARSVIYNLLCLVLAGGAACFLRLGKDAQVRTLLMSAVAGAALFLGYSSFVADRRNTSSASNYYAYTLNQHQVGLRYEVVDTLSAAPAILQSSMLQGTAYFTGGYEGLAIALAKPDITFGFGFGHSRFLLRMYERMFGPAEVNRRSYFNRIIAEDGYPSYGWVTMYPWIASDTTFVGSLPILFFLGRWLHLSWIQVVSGTSPDAAAAFGWLVLLFSMAPIELVVAGYGSLLSFYGTILIWLLQTQRRRRAEWRR
jgi:hypothetical protein